MNEPQVWTLIGVFAASLFAVMTLMSTLFIRVLRAEISGVRAEIAGLRGEMRAEIDGLRTEMLLRFEAMEAKFERRFDHLDRDVRALAKVVFPEN